VERLHRRRGRVPYRTAVRDGACCDAARRLLSVTVEQPRSGPAHENAFERRFARPIEWTRRHVPYLARSRSALRVVLGIYLVTLAVLSPWLAPRLILGLPVLLGGWCLTVLYFASSPAPERP
jgi:hypothetical protein